MAYAFDDSKPKNQKITLEMLEMEGNTVNVPASNLFEPNEVLLLEFKHKAGQAEEIIKSKTSDLEKEAQNYQSASN